MIEVAVLMIYKLVFCIRIVNNFKYFSQSTIDGSSLLLIFKIREIEIPVT